MKVKGDAMTRVLLAGIAVLLGLNLVAPLFAPRSSYGQRGVEYIVVEKSARALNLTPAQDFEVFLNGYGREGWQLVSFRGPNNSFIFVR